MNREDLVTIFSMYGYVLDNKKEDNYYIFSLGSGMYPAVEIIPLQDNIEKEICKIKEEYAQSGYAVKICNAQSISEIENYLFNGFFHVKIANCKIKQKYIDYANSIMEIYDKDYKSYEYINIPYLVEYNFDKKNTSLNLKDSIYSYLSSKRPLLIIVEAAAGLGKTSTAYELLNFYSDVTENIRPFLMELSKDRFASNFRYLLLSQIEQNFDILLKNDIVIYNIKQGRIPLIIDGFDELLSKDLDNGTKDAKFSDVETMLSTIADLLTDKSKVILTTRKTAIFSGDSFMDWIYQKIDTNYDFDVVRYQLDNPSIEDWLTPERRHKLSSNILESLCNPVLLGYLKYIKDEEFNEAIKDNSTLVNQYFKFLLTREIKRQALPFNIEEQKIILRKLASYFGGFNISSDLRSNVKDSIKELAYDLIELKANNQKNADSLANTLTNHALLDRKNDNNVGFLNDFVFGSLLMESINNDEDENSIMFHHELCFPFIEKMIGAASIQDIESRKQFYTKLKTHCNLNNILLFWADVKLCNQTNTSFKNEAFDGGSIINAYMGKELIKFHNCCFSNIHFINCLFDFKQFIDCSFINCSFLGCIKDITNSHCNFYNCESDDISFIDLEENHCLLDDTENQLDDDAFAKKLLEMYLKVGGRGRRMRMISKLRDSSGMDEKIFKKNFSMLITEGYIKCNGDKSFITDEGVEFLK